MRYATCHPDRKHCAKGLCANCYSIEQGRKPDSVKTDRNYRFLTRYGITLEEYEKRLKDQDGKCALCLKQPPGKRPLMVDHNHQTGNVRGLLCIKCNHYLGAIDEPGYLQRLLEYLA